MDGQFPPGVWETADREGIHIREVYARFGLAMYQAQVLEHGMVNAIIVLNLLPRTAEFGVRIEWEQAVDDCFEDQFSKTFGNLIQTLDKIDALPDHVLRVMRSAKRTRDQLAHRFFRDNAEDFMSEPGRLKMIQYCEDAANQFSDVDADLEKFIAPLRTKYGISEEHVLKEVARLNQRS
jgi:hypothetical protein